MDTTGYNTNYDGEWFDCQSSTYPDKEKPECINLVSQKGNFCGPCYSSIEEAGDWIEIFGYWKSSLDRNMKDDGTRYCLGDLEDGSVFRIKEFLFQVHSIDFMTDEVLILRHPVSKGNTHSPPLFAGTNTFIDEIIRI